MLNTVHLYLRFLGVSMQSQMQYRVSFTLLTLGQFAVTAIEFLAILVLFDRFNSLDEWSLPEVAFFYGLVNIAFSIADAAAYGFDHFGNMVKSGDFDRLLLRPRSTALQLAGQELTLRRVGRLAQGLVILLWASAALDLGWTPAKVALIIKRDRRRCGPLHGPYGSTGHLGLLGHRNPGDIRRRDPRRSSGFPVPTGDLPALVPEVFHLRGAPGNRELLSFPGHH